MAVKVNQHDLAFILDQIKIAEAHAGGTPLNELVDSPLLPSGLRTVDGSYNNFGPGRESWGASGEPFPGLTDPNWVVGSGTLGGPPYPTNNDYGTPGSVVDGEPRLISNLIIDQTMANPAAIYTALQHAGFEGDIVATVREIHTAYMAAEEPGRAAIAAELATTYGFEMDGPTIFLPNVAPDEGLSAPYNSFFTFFGQFFDHGLDLVAKGGNGTVYMPLSEDDPLYNPLTPHTNFMVMTRATTDTNGAGNVTTPWVDQNQTYTSNASHQVFLREYEMDATGRPVATGHLLEGARGLATWADVKAQARDLLGIELTDLDVGRVPMLAVDPYGEFIRGENGLPKVLAAFRKVGEDEEGQPILEPIYVSGDLTNPVNPSAIVLPAGTEVFDRATGENRAIAEGEAVSAARTGVAFLDDIAHAAAPVVNQAGELVADTDTVAGNAVTMDQRGRNTEYDNELLDAHYITGDGRGNENIGLSAVHHIFHSEHNRQVDDIKATIEASGDAAFIAQWKLDDGSWDGERLFQAARFTTEMQYQHLVFEEFARKVQPDVDVFVVQPDAEMDPSIFAEFAHVIYRFGHSMLNETVEMMDENGDRSGSMSLFDAFLNPLAFGAVDADGNVIVSHHEAAGAIIRGMTGQVGQEIDEFVTNTLRNQLLGIPLDLAAINIARGRDTGMPTLNEARAQFMEMAGGDTQLKPYESWSDFALNLKNPASVINFIAAYGEHPLIAAETTLAGKRAAATAIVFNQAQEIAETVDAPAGIVWSGTISEDEPYGVADENPLVDDAYYLATHTDVNSTSYPAGPDAHYANTGWSEGRSPNAFFDFEYYRAQLVALDPAFESTGVDLLAHYATEGWLLGLNPSANFDGNRYLAENPDVAAANVNPLQHFLVNGRHLDEQRPYYPVGQATGARTIDVPADRFDFLNSTGAWSAANSGLNNIDLWIGGLAEKKMPFGGMLGSTFSFVFEMQMESLQDADRFYYLSRVQGLNLLTELENNSLAKMALANTDLGETGFAIPADQFSVPNHVLYMDLAKQLALTGLADPEHDEPTLAALSKLVERRDSNGDGIAEYIRYNGADHVAIQGTDGDDHIVAGGGDDTVYGGAGNDRIEAGYGVDKINGGDGDDIITNSGTDIGEVDMLKGDDGNDVIHGGSGHALIFGGRGKDFLITGPDGSEIRAGEGDDFLLGGEGQDALFGNEGNDWIEGKARADFMAGDNAELFFNSTVIGHDVLNGGQGDTDYDADSGDDIMVAGEGIQKSIGMWGHDWVIHKGQKVGADADMNVEVFTTLPLEVLRDRFSQVESLSGWRHDDILRGDDRGDEEGDAGAVVADPTPEGNFVHNELDQAGIDRIRGLDGLITPDMMREGEYWADGSGTVKSVFTGGNILLGGGGSDVIEGRGGNDVIDGDAWLNVRISIVANRDGSGDEIATVDSMDGPVTLDGVTRPLTAWMVEGRINPAQLHIVREILDGNQAGDVDTAVYSDVLANYTFSKKADGSIIVDHTGFVDAGGAANRVSDGTDTIRNIEVLRFSDGNGGTVDVLASELPYQATGVPVISDMTPTEGETLTVNLSEIADGNGLPAANGFSFQWQYLDGTTWTDIPGADEASFTPNDPNLLQQLFGDISEIGRQLRVEVTFVDDAGYEEVVYSEPTAAVTEAGQVWNRSLFTGATFNGGDGDDVATGSNGSNGFFGIGAYTANETLNGNGGDDILIGLGGNDTLNGGSGNDQLDGGTGNDVLNGGADNDTIAGGAGNDTIIQLSTDGRDVIDGGSGTDTYQLNGVEGAETFTIYSRAAAQSAITGLTLAAATEIVIARNGVVIAELDNIEEIRVNSLQVTSPGGAGGGANGGDTIEVVGDFTGTNLLFSTITIDGGEGSDTIDISSLDSAHRIVFRSNGGQDTIVGQLRPQDVIELPAGSNPADYELIENENGTKTLRSADHSVTFASDGTPEVRVFDPTAVVDHSDEDTDEPVTDTPVPNEDDEDEQETDENEVDDEVEDEDDDHIGDDDEDEDDDHIGDDDEDEDDDHVVDEDDEHVVDEDEEEDDEDEDVAAGGSPASGVPTAGADFLVGTSGNDTLLGLGGNDSILGGDGADVIVGGDGDDFLSGDAGRDVIFGGAGNDDVLGGDGADMLYGDAGNDRILGGAGDDLISGGAGNDTVFGGAGDDTFLAEAGDGNDTYYGDDLGGGTGIDTLDMSAIMANITADLGSGLGGRGRVSSAETGNDVLHGVENIVTGSGDDDITASSAVNVIDGGGGDDVFRFLSAGDADGDTIVGFQPGDRIDLSGIDADTGVCGNQSFTLVSDGFTGAGQVMISEEMREDGAYTILRGTTNGDDEAEFEISIKGQHQITEAQLGL